MFSIIAFQLPLTVFADHQVKIDEAIPTDFSLTGYDNRHNEIFFQFNNINNAVNYGVRCSGVDGIFLEKVSLFGQQYQADTAGYNSAMFPDIYTGLTSTLTGSSVPGNSNIVLPVVGDSRVGLGRSGGTLVQSQTDSFIFNPDFDKTSRGFFTDSDYFFNYALGRMPQSSLTRTIAEGNYSLSHFSENPFNWSDGSIINSSLISKTGNGVIDLSPGSLGSFKVSNDLSSEISGIGIRLLLNFTSTHPQTTAVGGSLDQFRLAGVYSTSFDILQKNFNTIQLVESFIQNGIGAKNIEVRKGDLLLTISNNTDSVNENNWHTFYERDLDNGFPASNFIKNPYKGFEAKVHAFTQEGLEVIFDNSQNSAYVQGYHLRPLYDLDTLHLGTGSSVNIIIPKYYFSNLTTTECVGFAFYHELYPNSPEFIATDPVTITINHDIACQDSDNFDLPSTKLTDAVPLTFSDIRPSDYCDGSNVFTRTIPIDIFNATDSGELVKGYVSYAKSISGINTEITAFSNIIVEPRGSVPNSRFISNYDIDGGCFAIPSSTGIPLEMTPTRVTYNGFDYNLERVLFPTESYKFDSFTVICENMQVRVEGSTYAQIPKISKSIGAQEYFYKAILQDIDADIWGWGLGSENVTLSSGGTVQIDKTIMGMPFMLVMVLFSAMVGYQKSHLPAALITFFAIIGAALFFEIIDIDYGVLSGVLVLVIIGIFSRGFK